MTPEILRLIAVAAEVEYAIRCEGRKPAHHRKVMAKHRKEWPTLWEEIDKLLKELA